MFRELTKIFFVLVFVVCCGLIVMLCYILMIGKNLHTLALYSDFIATDLAYFGYDKKFELHAVQIFLGTALLSTPLVIWMYEKRYLQSINKIVENSLNIVTLIPSEIRKLIINLRTGLLNCDINVYITT